MADQDDQRQRDRELPLEAVEDLGTLNVPPETYHAVFVRDPVGAKVLEDLVARYHDCEIAKDAERTHDVSRAIGRRDVVQFILRRVGQIKGGA